MPRLTLAALTEDDLPTLARYQNTTAEALASMLAAARVRLHEGRYYEPFAVRCDDCLVGVVSLFEQPDGRSAMVWMYFRRIVSAGMPFVLCRC